MEHVFPDNYTCTDLVQVMKSQYQSPRWKEIAEYELTRRKFEWQRTGIPRVYNEYV
mgnify:CR=1|jgi:hypothetical protein